MNRRDFCRLAAMGVGANVLGRPSFAAAQRRHDSTAPILAVTYDQRYADAREFAGALRRSGATAFPTGGSSACHWYGELGALLRQRLGRVAGLGTPTDFLIAKTCGREMGLVPVFEGTHDARGSELVTHRYRLPGAARFFGKIAPEPALRPGELAEFLNGIGGNGEDWGVVEATGPRSSDHPGYLVSWLLEPRGPRPGSASG